MTLECKHCFITGARDNKKRTLHNALSKISEFEQNGFVPAGRKDVLPIPIELPFDWSYGPNKDPNWRMQCHAWRMLDPYFIAYEASNEETYLHRILEYVFDWWCWLEFRADDIGRAWYDLSVGLRSCKIAILYQWIKEKNLQKRLVVENLVLAHVNNLLTEENINKGNHGIFQAHGLRCLATVGAVSESIRDAAIVASEKYLNAIFNSQFDKECVHQEGSFEYHRFAIDKFKSVINAPVWGEQVTSRIEAAIRNAEINYYWMTYPDGREVPVGDSSGKNCFLNKQDSRSSITWRSSTGYNVLKINKDTETADAYLLFITKQHKLMHGHDDFGSLVVWQDGFPILLDPGKYAYVKDKYREYFISSLAHNTARLSNVSYKPENVSIDKFSFKWVDAELRARLVLKCFNNNGSSIMQCRNILYRPNEYLKVEDSFLSDDIESMLINWHFSDEITLNNLCNGKRKTEKNVINFEVYGANDTSLRIRNVDRYNTKELGGICSLSGNYKEISPCKTVRVETSGKKSEVFSKFILNKN